MISAEVIDAMIAAGASADIIAAAWKADLAQQERKIAERRAKDAERQQRKRKRDRDHAESRDVTVTQRDSRDDPLPNDINSNPSPTSSDCSDEQSSSPKPKRKTAQRKAKANGAAEQLPDWMPQQEWSDFVAMRKAMRNVPFTPAAQRNIILKLDELRLEGHDVAAMLRSSVSNGWRGVFAPEARHTKATGPPPQMSFTEFSRREREAQGRRT